MLTIMIICVCLICLIALGILAGFICFIGVWTDSVPYVMIAIFVGFFVGHIVLDFVFSMLTEIYNLTPFFWEWN